MQKENGFSELVAKACTSILYSKYDNEDLLFQFYFNIRYYTDHLLRIYPTDEENLDCRAYKYVTDLTCPEHYSLTLFMPKFKLNIGIFLKQFLLKIFEETQINVSITVEEIKNVLENRITKYSNRLLN